MRNNAFTYIEMVAALTVIVVLVSITLYFVHPNLSYAQKTTFINQANNIVKAAINKYTEDSQDEDDGYPDDIYVHDKKDDKFEGRVCYNLKSLKSKYINKLSDRFQGSIEICTSSKCDYKTRLWLSNDEYYIDGVKDSIHRNNLSNHVFGINHCGNNY